MRKLFKTLTTAVLAFATASVSARTVVDLSGEGWTFDGKPVAIPHTWNADDGSDGVGRMHEWGLGDSVGSPSYSRGPHVYLRALPDPKPGKRYFVRCHGVSSKAEVDVNGVNIGEHSGAFTAFTFEITAVLKPEGNILEITADNTYDLNVPPVSGDFTMYGGVYRRVELIETEEICIDPCWYGTDAVEITADPDTGKVVAKIGVSAGVGHGHAECVTLPDREWWTIEYDFGKVELWSPESPKLYEVEINIGRDLITRKVGFRKIEWKDDGFY